MTKKLISIATSIAMLFGGFGMATTPVNVNAKIDNGFTGEEISKSPLKPEITVDKVCLTIDEAWHHIYNHTPVEVNVTLSGGMDGKYSTTGTHVDFDNRLSYPVKKDGSPDIKIGKAFEQLDLISVGEYVTKYGDSRFSIMTNSSSDNGHDGTMYTLQFYLPEDVQPDDLYPVDLVYMDGDMFTDVADSKEAQLAQACLFTQGFDNGWIQIEGDYAETTTTAPKPTTITTTTSTATSTATAPATTTTETVVTYAVNGVDISIESVPTKTVYNAGEKLDLTGGVYKLDWLFGPFSGGTAFRQTQETRSMTSVGSEVKIDTSEFDNTKAGTYKIYITGYFGSQYDTESFEVEVLPETTTTTAMTTEAPEVTTTETVVTYAVNGIDISIESVPTKTVYNIGEKLDLTGGVYKYDWLFGPFTGGTAFKQTQETCSMTSIGRDVTIDTSEFDNTKAGTYKIYITANLSFNEFSDTEYFEVEVLPQIVTTTATKITTTTAQIITTTETATPTYAVKDVELSVESVPTKTAYNIGEELDLTGGSYKYYIVLDHYYMGYWDKKLYATRSMTETDSNVKIDTSEFDNTKAGTYKIYITVTLNWGMQPMSDTKYFEVTVKNPLESESGITLPYGDADCDGKVDINDAVLVMQSIANPDKYKLTNIGKMTADVVDKGNGITNADALAIQYVESKTIKVSDLPITSKELDKLAQ